MNATFTPRRADFREAIDRFLSVRRDAKLDKLADDDPKRAELIAQFQTTAWIEDAARRVTQIQAVTHTLKPTHPDARGTNLYRRPSDLPPHTLIGSHTLPSDFDSDVVGNAAALDVYKFLCVEIAGKSLLDWLVADDAELKAALHESPQAAERLSAAFKGLIQTRGDEVASHSLAKQLYWLVGEEPTCDEHYQLLAPLFSSSLAHAVHADIQDARFGEANKLARQAFRSKEASDAVYRDYPRLAIRKLGGTKPQNISQLNSERGGINYLLASLPPPAWKKDRQPKLLHRDSALESFFWFEDVREQIKTLADFLLANPDPTKETRERREALEQALGQQLAVFGAHIRNQLGTGWTRNPDCHLPLCEQLWLDPDRIELPLRDSHQQEDAEFNAAYDWGDWPDEVAGRFAGWLNNQLHKAGLVTVGDPEHQHWARQAILDSAWPVPMQRRAIEGTA